MSPGKGRAGIASTHHSTEGWVVDGYNLWTSPSCRGPGLAQRRGVGADHRVCGSRTNGGGRSAVRRSGHRGPQRAECALFSYNRRWTKTAITF